MVFASTPAFCIMSNRCSALPTSHAHVVVVVLIVVLVVVAFGCDCCCRSSSSPFQQPGLPGCVQILLAPELEDDSKWRVPRCIQLRPAPAPGIDTSANAPHYTSMLFHSRPSRRSKSIPLKRPLIEGRCIFIPCRPGCFVEGS